MDERSQRLIVDLSGKRFNILVKPVIIFMRIEAQISEHQNIIFFPTKEVCCTLYDPKYILQSFFDLSKQ